VFRLGSRRPEEAVVELTHGGRVAFVIRQECTARVGVLGRVVAHPAAQALDLLHVVG